MDEAQAAEQLELAVAGDQDALQRLIVHHHGALHHKLAARMDDGLRRRIDADDILQEAYVAAFKALAVPPRARERPPDHTPRGTAVPAVSSTSHDTADTAVPSTGRPAFDSPAGFYKWLETIAFNQLRDQHRALHRQKRDIAREAADRPDPSTSYPDLLNRISAGESTPSRQVAKDEATAAVMSSLARLTDEQRAVVRLRFIEGRSVAEIAAELGKTEDAVHKLCFRGLKNLRRMLVSITRFLTNL
jgi:RNA polymerase sigma factor (sigma-70 family)